MSEAGQEQTTAPAGIWTPAAILADLDGTLVDSVASSERAWGAFARRRGLDEEETHRFAMGRPTRETVALLVPEGERDAEQGQIDRDEVDDADSVIVYPGAAELLAGPIPIAVVTSGSTALATARLRGAGLEPPAVLITADRVTRGKPDPEPFLLGAREIGVDPARCLALEDAPSGIESARRGRHPRGRLPHLPPRRGTGGRRRDPRHPRRSRISATPGLRDAR
ncbi:MAG: HAD-IA family hydrolase [Actinobacteria bacterium]|nr:HAD-IA family hydrolase [Actinomycetota bacterium]